MCVLYKTVVQTYRRAAHGEMIYIQSGDYQHCVVCYFHCMYFHGLFTEFKIELGVDITNMRLTLRGKQDEQIDT